MHIRGRRQRSKSWRRLRASDVDPIATGSGLYRRAPNRAVSRPPALFPSTVCGLCGAILVRAHNTITD